jgi:arylsulfatase A-like enzyme
MYLCDTKTRTCICVRAHLRRVLDTLESTGLDKNTILTFIGDHGYQNGAASEFGPTQFCSIGLCFFSLYLNDLRPNDVKLTPAQFRRNLAASCLHLAMLLGCSGVFEPFHEYMATMSK